MPSLKEIEWKARYSGETDNLLTAFYIPALSRSVAYDRKAGFFSSTALAVAAQGIAKLIRNGGRMRLLVGCYLTEEDVEAIKKGYELAQRVEERLEERFGEPVDEFQRRRLEALAWMVAKGLLEIKVAVPKEDDGTPIASEAAEGIFHEKVGIFTDSEGNKLVFSGSVNETEQGWLKNRESFHVFRSWGDEAVHASSEVDEFETLWRGQGRRTIVLDFPEALRRKLIKYAPSEPPTRDPLEPEEAVLTPMEEAAERWLFQFLRDAPYLLNGELIANATATVRPWPHQDYVVREIFSNYPDGYMLCDEVGLGKTIEAGLALKQLLLTGLVKRCLLLVPKALIRQWQEELHEKFNLNIPIYTGKDFVDVFGRRFEANASNPWNTFDVFLATSHLAKRRERREALLKAAKWDLIILDEAHHARRHAPTGREYRPNNLLQLMEELRKRTSGLLLVTATPMQLDPVELWDLLKLLGMGGRWGAGEGELFRRYFKELKAFPGGCDAEFLREMLKDYLENGGTLDEVIVEKAEKAIGVERWGRLLRGWRGKAQLPPLDSLNDEEISHCAQFLARHTPLRDYMFRNTREMLKKYREKGLLHQNIPERETEDRFVELAEDEQELYERIEDYLQEWRRREEDRRYGFILSIYRRRLTSSLYAIKESLRRRIEFLKGEGGEDETPLGLTDEDIEDEDLDADIMTALEEIAEQRDLRKEIEYLEDFIREIEGAGVESKFKRLEVDLRNELKVHASAVIFTQYTDTMDYLRDELVAIYGSSVACYSGRGGEYWDGESWQLTTKEDIKNRFMNGREIRILVCTDAASEGLNLQTCDLLINWDMPWNPMKVEQRIGRIDRIGQVSPKVKILNYFYEGTVEAEVYRRLSERIGSFTVTVGPLQPILARLPKLIEEIAFTARKERDAKLQEALEKLDREIERARAENLNLEDYLGAEPMALPQGQQAPVTMEDIRELLTESRLLRRRTCFEDEGDGVLRLKTEEDEELVTFDPDVFDSHPDTVKFMCYGEPLFERLLNMVGNPDSETDGLPLVRIVQERNGIRVVSYFWHSGESGSGWREVKTMGELRAYLNIALETPIPSKPTAEDIERLVSCVSTRLEGLLGRVKKKCKQRGRRLLAAIKATAEELLVERLALDYAMELAAADEEETASDVDPTQFLKKKLQMRQPPYPALTQIIGKQLSEIKISSGDFLKYLGRKRESIAASIGNNNRRVRAVVNQYREAEHLFAENLRR